MYLSGEKGSSSKDNVGRGRRGQGLEDSVCYIGQRAVQAVRVQGQVLTVLAVREARQEPDLHGLMARPRL